MAKKIQTKLSLHQIKVLDAGAKAFRLQRSDGKVVFIPMSFLAMWWMYKHLKNAKPITRARLFIFMSFTVPCGTGLRTLWRLWWLQMAKYELQSAACF
jgi:hypothetical protein